MNPAAFTIATQASRRALVGAHATDPVLPAAPRTTRRRRRRPATA